MTQRRQTLDWLLEIVSLLALLGCFWVVLSAWPRIPAQAPLHFNAAGKPDGYGDRTGLFLLPSTALSLYVLLTVAAVRQQLINVPMNIDRSRPEVRALLARMALALKAITLLTLLYLVRAAVQTALGAAHGLGMQFLPITLVAVFAGLGYFINELRRYQN